MINNFLIGTDYEYFVKNNQGDVASAIGFIGGTKKEPLSIGEGCFRQSDNILAEANHPPVNSLKDWLYYFGYAKEKMQEVLTPHELNLYVSTSEYIQDKYLSDKKAREFGCEPSFCAYPNDINCNIDPMSNLRTAGLHVHIGTKEGDVESEEELCRLMKIMDMNLGAPSVLLDPDRIRRKMYGLAGEYRFADRGDWQVFEYRSLGSFFLHSEELLQFVYEQTIKSIEDFNNGVNPSDELQEAINNYNVEECIRLMGEENYAKVKQLQLNVV